MRTTLDLPDELVQRLQRRAQHDGRTPEQLAADLLAAGLPPDSASAPADPPAIVPKHLPLIKARPAEPVDAKKLTTQEFCDWIKDLDLQMEIERYEKALDTNTWIALTVETHTQHPAAKRWYNTCGQLPPDVLFAARYRL